jgi:hypothetical protein
VTEPGTLGQTRENGRLAGGGLARERWHAVRSHPRGLVGYRAASLQLVQEMAPDPRIAGKSSKGAQSSLCSAEATH